MTSVFCNCELKTFDTSYQRVFQNAIDRCYFSVVRIYGALESLIE